MPKPQKTDGVKVPKPSARQKKPGRHKTRARETSARGRRRGLHHGASATAAARERRRGHPGAGRAAMRRGKRPRASARELRRGDRRRSDQFSRASSGRQRRARGQGAGWTVKGRAGVGSGAGALSARARALPRASARLAGPLAHIRSDVISWSSRVAFTHLRSFSLLTAAGFEPTPLRTGAWSQCLGPSELMYI